MASAPPDGSGSTSRTTRDCATMQKLHRNGEMWQKFQGIHLVSKTPDPKSDETLRHAWNESGPKMSNCGSDLARIHQAMDLWGLPEVSGTRVFAADSLSSLTGCEVSGLVSRRSHRYSTGLGVLGLQQCLSGWLTSNGNQMNARTFALHCNKMTVVIDFALFWLMGVYFWQCK